MFWLTLYMNKEVKPLNYNFSSYSSTECCFFPVKNVVRFVISFSIIISYCCGIMAQCLVSFSLLNNLYWICCLSSKLCSCVKGTWPRGSQLCYMSVGSMVINYYCWYRLLLFSNFGKRQTGWVCRSESLAEVCVLLFLAKVRDKL